MRFHWLCKMGDVRRIHKLLIRGARINLPWILEEYGDNVLAIMLDHGLNNGLHMLLYYRANPNRLSHKHGVPPLWLACEKRNTYAIRKLLIYGARVDFFHPEERKTILHILVKRADLKMLKEVCRTSTRADVAHLLKALALEDGDGLKPSALARARADTSSSREDEDSSKEIIHWLTLKERDLLASTMKAMQDQLGKHLGTGASGGKLGAQLNPALLAGALNMAGGRRDGGGDAGHQEARAHADAEADHELRGGRDPEHGVVVERR